MKINFFSRWLLLGLNVCCIFAAEKPNSETSAETVCQDIANQAVVLKLLKDDPNWRAQFPGIQQIKITQEMIHGSDLAGKLSEEFRKKNMVEDMQISSDEEICSLRIALKW